MKDNKQEKVARLQQALDDFARGEHEPLFDREYEQRKAAVRNRALGLLDHRARSEEELRQRLLAAEFESVLIDDVIGDLRENGLVDDSAFAKEWVRQRHARRGKSRRALDLELQAKGVTGETRQEALDTIDESDEEAMATELARKKARTIKASPSDRADYDKLLARIVGLLARRGYPQSMSMRVARVALDARIAEL